MANWRPVLQVLFRRIRATSASELYVQLRDTTGSGEVILGPRKLSLPVFCQVDHSAPFGHPRFAWISKMGSWRPVIRVLFKLLQQVSYVQLNDTAGSGGVILRPRKLFLHVLCRIDHSAPFGHPRFAWISKMASWRPVLQVLFRRIRATSACELYVQLNDTAGSGGVILRPRKLCLHVLCRIDHSAPFGHPRFAWISKIASWRPVEHVLFRRIRATSACELYVQLKDTAGSLGVILGPTKLFLLFCCKIDHFAPFGHPRLA